MLVGEAAVWLHSESNFVSYVFCQYSGLPSYTRVSSLPLRVLASKSAVLFVRSEEAVLSGEGVSSIAREANMPFISRKSVLVWSRGCVVRSSIKPLIWRTIGG